MPSTEPIEVWIRRGGADTSPGVHIPFIDQPTGWTLAGRADVAFSSSGGLTEVPIDLNAFLRTGEKIGIAVYSNTHSNGIRAENPPQGTSVFSDGNVLLDRWWAGSSGRSRGRGSPGCASTRRPAASGAWPAPCTPVSAVVKKRGNPVTKADAARREP